MVISTLDSGVSLAHMHCCGQSEVRVEGLARRCLYQICCASHVSVRLQCRFWRVLFMPIYVCVFRAEGQVRSTWRSCTPWGVLVGASRGSETQGPSCVGSPAQLTFLPKMLPSACPCLAGLLDPGQLGPCASVFGEGVCQCTTGLENVGIHLSLGLKKSVHMSFMGPQSWGSLTVGLAGWCVCLVILPQALSPPTTFRSFSLVYN